jgi:hypothetical protein
MRVRERPLRPPVAPAMSLPVLGFFSLGPIVFIAIVSFATCS